MTLYWRYDTKPLRMTISELRGPIYPLGLSLRLLNEGVCSAQTLYQSLAKNRDR